ncbi:MAG: inositol-3-phosphate synthase [Planctomycetota bacterium]|nr:inositol-3-phosphate synthase [Planctomycetota bacterium]
MSDKFGIWLIGAWGGVSTTTVVGLASFQKQLAEQTGLVSALPKFADLQLATWDQFVVGGHEIRDTSYVDEARALHKTAGVFDRDDLDAIAPTLDEFNANVRTGTLLAVGSRIESLASDTARATAGESTSAAIARLSTDIREFRERHGLKHVVVVNLASTEPAVDSNIHELTWSELSTQLDRIEVPASTLYAIAAMQAGCSYVNFTPSVGSDLPALDEFAAESGSLHVGRDGKTGETLMKSVLAPMFADRHLKVMSWVGHNIFGNMDAEVLDDPANKANKVRSKDHLLTEILGYPPQSLVSIENIRSLGDWKTAWDHIHFQGFLNTKMALQFTWQGCDSLLAAPLVLDLVRFTEREWRRGGRSGVMSHLGSFFKSPMKCETPEFAKQYIQLEDWAVEVSAE